MPAPELIDVPVAGGVLRVARWDAGPDAPIAVVAHGITANHRSWSAVADQLGGDVTLIAPDLRGRGGSNALPPPFGIPQHADDLVAVMDHLGIAAATVAGHSMGAWVAAVAAVRHPARVLSVVFADGGIRLREVPPEADVDAILHEILGPSMERLKTTFASRDVYRDFWRRHPAFEGAWNEHVEAYIDYDLIGEGPVLRSGVSLDAVYADSRDTLFDDLSCTAIRRIMQPAVFVRAARGVMNDAPGLYSEATIAALQRDVPHLHADLIDANHFTLVLGEGAPAVADHIRKACRA